MTRFAIREATVHDAEGIDETLDGSRYEIADQPAPGGTFEWVSREDARIELNRVMERRAEVHAELERLNRKILEQLGREPSGSDR